MKIENTKCYGYEAAFRGMRNSRQSWSKSDSRYGNYGDARFLSITPECPLIGPNDLSLAKRLIKAGTSHRKFLRQIGIWADFTLPSYAWSEFDTYKVGTSRNSCSTMYSLIDRPLTQEDFEYPIVAIYLEYLNQHIQHVKKNGAILDGLRNDLPSGYLLKSTITMNYENALNIFHQRTHHRLKCWSGEYNSIISWIKELPYMTDFIESLL